MIRRFFAVAALAMVLPVMAFAQAAAPVAAQPDVMTQIVGYVGTALAAFVVGLVTWALNKYFGININQSDQAKLETAMTNGIALAVSRTAPTGIQSAIDKDKVIGMAMDYVKEHVPDAAARLNATGRQLADKIEARLVQHPAAAAVAPATAT